MSEQEIGTPDDTAAVVAEQEFDLAVVRAALTESWTVVVSWVSLIAGAIGFLASATLTIEKFKLVADPDFEPSCNFSPLLSCGSVMNSEQAAVFGFPNPLLGIAGFAVMITVGVAGLAGGRFAGWFWWGVQFGVTAATVFVHWLIYTSLYELDTLCPYCMVVWAMTIPMFVFVTIRNLHASGLVARSPAMGAIARHHALIVVGWILTIVVLILNRFWWYWSSLY